MNREASVVHGGITNSQPGVNCSCRYPDSDGKVRLRVFRVYDQLTNEFGGKGRFKYLDADNKQFDTVEAARAFALDRGYTFIFHRKAYGLKAL